MNVYPVTWLKAATPAAVNRYSYTNLHYRKKNGKRTICGRELPPTAQEPESEVLTPPDCRQCLQKIRTDSLTVVLPKEGLSELADGVTV